MYFIICIVIGSVILLTDSKFYTATANILYVFGVVLLLLVFPFHTDIKGTQSIIRFSGFQLQPAELCKIFVNLALAKYLSPIYAPRKGPANKAIIPSPPDIKEMSAPRIKPKVLPRMPVGDPPYFFVPQIGAT